jgi:hypothetical protein
LPREGRSSSIPADEGGEVRRLVIGLAAGVLLAMAASPALAVSHPFPEPPHRLTVHGVIKGKLATGAKVRFRLTATDPKGWFDLSTVQILLLLNDQPIQVITFTPLKGTIESTGQPAVKFGGSKPVPGSFLSVVNGTTSRLVRQTFGVRVDLWTRILHDIPRDVVIRVAATSRAGKSSIAKLPVVLRGGYLSWGTFGLAAVAALFIGSIVGTARTAKRFKRREPSVWDILERRLREQRGRPPVFQAVATTDGGAR